MEKLLSLQEIKDLPDGTLVGFIANGWYFDIMYCVIDRGMLDCYHLCESVEKADLDDFLTDHGIPITDGKIRVILYKEI